MIRPKACRQGNDVGTQYRSGIYTFGAEQSALAESSQAAYQMRLQSAGHGAISTEILQAPTFYYAEGYHQQYLAKKSARLLRGRWYGRILRGLKKETPARALRGVNVGGRKGSCIRAR